MGGGTSSEFNAATNADVVAEAYKANCVGKTIIVTGGNSGIGLETVKVLAAQGAKVILCSRSISNGEASIAEFKSKHPNADITIMQLNLNSFQAIRDFADSYLATKKPLHVLINNAGIMGVPKALTENGIETQFGVNHMGHFLLTHLLLPALTKSGTPAAPARVVTLASSGNYTFNHTKEGIQFDDLKAEKSFDSFSRYGQSKLANILFARELNDRLKAQGAPVISVSVHPGVVRGTSLMTPSATNIYHLLSAFGSFGMFLHAFSVRMKSVPEGASTSVVAALSPSVVPGAYYADCQVCDKLHPKHNDPQLVRELWRVSEEIVANDGLK